MQTFSPDSLLPFDAYRTPRPDGRGFLRGGPELCPSVAHFFFSERFRGYDDPLRQELLDGHTASEARKITSRTENHPAWVERQDQIIRCALWKQFLVLPSLPNDLLTGSIKLTNGHCLGKGWEIRNAGNQRWSNLALTTASRFLAKGNHMSLLATGDTDVTNPFLFSSRLDVLLSNRQPDQMIIACRQGVDALAELWSIERYLPTIHSPLRSAPAAPIKDELLQSLVSHATHAILFAKDGSTVATALLPMLKAGQVPTRHVRLDSNGRPIPKATTPPRSVRPVQRS